jgi:hypothetical protein
MKMDEVSAELRALGAQHKLPRLYELADAVDHRDKPIVYTPGEELAARIRKYRYKNPDVSDVQIALRFGISGAAVKKIFSDPKPFAGSTIIKVKAKAKAKK